MWYNYSMNTDEQPKNTVEPLDDPEILEIFDDKLQKFEIIEYEGAEARFYPTTGAIMVFDEARNRWIIRANRGGRPDFDGRAMVAARELKKEQAIIDGLETAALHFDGRTASDMLERIVTARAKNAVDDEGRTGNADAKFIFSIVAQNSEGGEGEPSLRVDMDADTAAGFIAAMKEMMASKEEHGSND